MLAAERRNRVLVQVRSRGKVQVNELSRELGVSAMTVRRDLAWLERSGLVQRTHGGALDPRLLAEEVPLRRKSTRHPDEKRAIGRVAASLVEAGQTLVLDAGSTVLEAARALEARPLTVVTNDLVTALELADRPGVTLYCTGGQVRPQVYSLQGSHAEAFLTGIQVHVAFLGADGVDPDLGLFTTNLEKVAVKRAMIRAATRSYVLVDAAKLGTKGFARVAAVTEVMGVITTDRAPAPVVEALREKGLEVLLARASQVREGEAG
ncbi:DeoR/GlpR family DNA-binding transcription regulator [Limnochorda pilosa]|uniref:DeoR family transcriptional regulator n=1 Tax=Limnochorda pilosa TaxID=1555112 RepID=A0A0K2SL79_LIMPI|nr:DeoR/GlpR family DNA-binding transcription regulator [Limnochorda pilosa]BAS27752.1 DeoR family transcriptional regulator [Limnochorda pilosa]